MKPLRSTFLTLLMSASLLALNGMPAYAQEAINVRSGEHETYTRIVFDWNNNVKYKIDTAQDGVIKINFEKNASLKNLDQVQKSLKNLKDFEVISTSPLSVQAAIPKGSRTRSLIAGNRVVIDIFNPDGVRNFGNAPKVPSKNREAQKPAEEVAIAKPLEKPKPQPKPVRKEDPPQNAEPVKKIAKAKAKLEAQPTPKVEAKPDAVKNVEKKVIVQNTKILSAKPPVSKTTIPTAPVAKVKDVEKQTILAKASGSLDVDTITISSTKSTPMAAFILNEKIWMVAGRDDILLKPQVSGVNAEILKPIENQDMENAQAFILNALPTSILPRAQGGGLVWRLLYSTRQNEKEPAKIIRKNENTQNIRGGRIIIPLQNKATLIETTDPSTGLPLKIIPVTDATQFTGVKREFVDFTLLQSSLGLAILAKTEDLDIALTDESVIISRPGGLALSAQSDIDREMLRLQRQQNGKNQDNTKEQKPTNLFDFENWVMGGEKSLAENQSIVLGAVKDMPEGTEAEALLSLAQMYLANAQGAEALGFLRIVETDLPELARNPEFLAMKGAAQAIDNKSEAAFKTFSNDVLKPYQETGIWRAIALADLGDWSQAGQVMPNDLAPVYKYTDRVFDRVALLLAEIALRDGRLDIAENMLNEANKREDTMFPEQKAALKYLKGEAARQRGELEKTNDFWTPLTKGTDDLYRTKAGLALTRLKIDKGELKPAEAIDNLERLRYAWRGDILESQTLYWLGKTYFEADQYARGLNILREAAASASDYSFGGRITAEMSDLFSDLFLTDQLRTVSPMDAVALYEQFTELVPTGEKGERMVARLAEHLVQANLLTRAADLLQYQVDHRLSGFDSYKTAVRLAGIQLLDDKSDKAIENLKTASSVLQGLPEEVQTDARYMELSLLRARALSGKDKPDQALALLEDLDPAPDVNRLRADIAWNAQYWDDAADALNEVMIDRNISLTRPLEKPDADIILKRATALNLAGDRIGLANLRERFSDTMAQTGQAKVFDVVTRPRNNIALADRETLLGITAETDLFSDFLENYRQPEEAVN